MDPANQLEEGRRSYARREWVAAYESLSATDRVAPLEPEDLELLATSAYMLGRDEQFLAVMERAHHAHLEEGSPLRAARCAGPA